MGGENDNGNRNRNRDGMGNDWAMIICYLYESSCYLSLFNSNVNNG